MKKLVALLLVVAFLFGFGFTVVHAVGVEPSVVLADPGVPPPLPPVEWPPQSDSIGRG
jgi:hypothetical protein